MKILLINGPNLQLLGVREPGIYGNDTLPAIVSRLRTLAEELGCELVDFQSNHEGAIVDAIQQAYFNHIDGIVINPAAYTHTSVAILDALKAVNIPAVEVHLSDIYTREEFRHVSYPSLVCKKSIYGKGFEGYREAIQFLKEYLA